VTTGDVRALIVEDEPPARQSLRGLIERIDWLACVGEACDGLEAIEAIDRLRPDLVFLDIELPEVSGIDVLSRITHKPAVVFTTAYSEHAVAAFELQALDYLLKPFGAARFITAMERVRNGLRSAAPPVLDRAHRALGGGPLTRVFVRDRGRIVPVSVDEIERIEADGDYVALIVGGRRYLVDATLQDLTARIDPSRFVQIHRSHVVNLDFVLAFAPYDGSRLQATMRDGTKIIASRPRSAALRHLTL
jgi:two-component system, LytTR family, response regulator